jgi:hypothetical protein
MNIELSCREKETSLETFLAQIRDGRLYNVTINFQMEMNHGIGREELVYRVQADVKSDIILKALGLR